MLVYINRPIQSINIISIGLYEYWHLFCGEDKSTPEKSLTFPPLSWNCSLRIKTSFGNHMSDDTLTIPHPSPSAIFCPLIDSKKHISEGMTEEESFYIDIQWLLGALRVSTNLGLTATAMFAAEYSCMSLL